MMQNLMTRGVWHDTDDDDDDADTEHGVSAVCFVLFLTTASVTGCRGGRRLCTR